MGRDSAGWTESRARRSVVPPHPVVAGIHVPPDVVTDVVLDEPNAAVAHGDLDAAHVPAAGLGLLEGTARPRSHQARGIVDAPLAVVGVVFIRVGQAVVPAEVSRNDAGAGITQGPHAARIARAQVGADAE